MQELSSVIQGSLGEVVLRVGKPSLVVCSIVTCLLTSLILLREGEKHGKAVCFQFSLALWSAASQRLLQRAGVHMVHMVRGRPAGSQRLL